MCLLSGLEEHQGQDNQPGNQPDCHGPNAVRCHYGAITNLQDRHDNRMEAEGPYHGRECIFAPSPNQEACDKKRHQAQREIIDGQPVDDIIPGVLSEQHLPAGED